MLRGLKAGLLAVAVASAGLAPAEAASLVGTTTAPDALSSASRFFTHYANGYHWVAFHNGTTPVLYSSANGLTWTSQGNIFSGVNPSSAGQWAARFSGTDIIAFATNPSNPRRRWYRNGALGGSGGVTWNAADAQATSQAGNLEVNSLIANNKPILYVVDALSWGEEVIGSQLNGPTWTEPSVTPPAPAGATAGGFSAGALFPVGGSDPNDYIILRATTRTPYGAGSHRLVADRFDASVPVYVSNLQWYNVSLLGLPPGPYSLTETADTEVKEGTDAEAHVRFAAVRDTTGNIHAVYVNRNDNVVHYKKDVGFNDSWSRLFTDMTQSFSPIDRVALSALPGNGLVLFYSKSDNGIYYRRFDGTTWSTEATLKAASAIPLQGALAPAEVAAGCTLGIAWTEGSASPYNVMFATVALPNVCGSLTTAAAATTITVETADVKMVWDSGPNHGGGLAELYGRTEPSSTVNRSGDLTRYNVFSTQLTEQPGGGTWHFEGYESSGGGRPGNLELLEATSARVRVRQKYDYTTALHLDRDWTAYSYPRLAIDETLSFDRTELIRGAQGVHPKGETLCPGNTFYCAGSSNEADRIWLVTDNASMHSDMLGIAYTSPFFGRAGSGYSWDALFETGTPNSFFSRVWEGTRLSTPAGSYVRFYLFYPHLAGLTSTGSEWQPYAAEYRAPDTLTILSGSGWFDPSENTSAPLDHFNEAENAYALELDPPRGLRFAIDGLATNRKKPFFKMRQWRSLEPPASLTLNGATLTRGVHYLADVKPISRGHFCNPGCAALASGGLTSDPAEFLNDATRNYTFGFAGANALYLGADSKFRGLGVALATVGAGSADLQWQYWDGARWAGLEAVPGFTDKTNSFKSNGSIHWATDPPGWTPSSVNGGPLLYYVRAVLASGIYTTPPTESRIRTDILLFQYLSDVTLDGQTFSVASPVPTTHYRSIGTAGNYSTGTVTVTNGSRIVTGAATAWRAANRGRGDRITIPCPDPPTCTGGAHYTVLEVHSDTRLELATPFTGPTGSGMSHTIARQFATLQAWEDCISFATPCPYFPVVSADLVADNRSEVGLAYQDSVFALTADLVIQGSVTDATHTITLTAAPGNRHLGTAGAGVIVDGQNAPNEVVIQDSNVTLEWLELARVRGADFIAAVKVGSGGKAPTNVLVQNVLIHDFDDASFSVDGIRLSGPAGKGLTIRNCMIWDGDRYGIEGDEAGDMVSIDNCSIDSMQNSGIYAQNSTFTVRNTIVTTSGVTDYATATGSLTGSNNTSEDPTATTYFANPLTGVTAASVFVAPNADLHLKAGSSQIDTGLDLSPAFSNDVDAGRRPVGPAWDRGADELGAAAGPDLSITVDDGQTTATPGGSVTYTLTVSNNGPGTMSSVTIFDSGPPGSPPGTLSGFGASSGSYNPLTGEWTVTLGPGQSETLTLTFSISPSARGQLVYTAQVADTAGSTDPDPLDNQATDIDALLPEADLVLGKLDSADPVVVGDNFDYTLTVDNNGISDATGVTLTDPLPGGLDFVSASPGPPTCVYASASRTVSCDLGVIPAAGSATVTLTVRVVTAGAKTNTAGVTAHESDPAPGNETDTETTAVVLPGDAVQVFTVTSKSGQNVLEWINPAIGASYVTTRILYKAIPGTSNCAFPANETDGTDLMLPPGSAGQKDSFPHAPLANDNTTYCYGAFVQTTSGWSAGRFTRGRPFDDTGVVKWAYSTGAAALAPPGVGTTAVHATSNDNALHAMDKATGRWPTSPGAWKPAPMSGPSQGRPSTVPIRVLFSDRVIYLGSQDGNVYAMDADTGMQVWNRDLAALWGSGTKVQAAPSGIFAAFAPQFGTSLSYSYILVGTRLSTGDNAFYALNMADGSVAVGWPFSDGGVEGKFGPVNYQASVEYNAPSAPNHRVYFTSFARGVAPNNTVWCLDLDSGGLVWAEAVASVSTSPTLNAGVRRLYVGSFDGVNGFVQALDADSGAVLWTVPTSDGPVKGLVMMDRTTGDLYFSTNTKVHAWTAGGAPKWAAPRAGIPSPSAPVILAGSGRVYVGGGDGRLYMLKASDGSDELAPITLGDGLAGVGRPTLDVRGARIYVGSEAGVIYAVDIP